MAEKRARDIELDLPKVEATKPAIKKFKVNWAISVSGIAGPAGGTKIKPVGLVNFCIKGPKTLITWEERFGSNKTREDIQKLSVLNALDRLRLSIIMAN